MGKELPFPMLNPTTLLASNFHSFRKSNTDGTSELLAEVAYNVKVIHFTKAHKIWC